MSAATESSDKLFLIGYSGELSIKGKGTRNRFTERLVRNLGDALTSAGIPFTVERTWARLFLRSPAAEAGERARRVFGVQSVAPAEERRWQSLEDLLRAGEELFAPVVAGKTFAVRVRRGGESSRIPFRSPQVERELGARLLPGARGVDLRRPEVTVRIELRRGSAYFFHRHDAAHGGLPLGTEGRAVALVSGGFDSLVASWLMLRRGVTLDYVFCNLAGVAHRDAVLQVAKVLADGWCYGYRPRFHLVDFQPAAEEIQARCPQGLWQVVLKRQMLRVADRVARMVKAAAIVTGDAVGQVSSQTLQNLAVVSAVTELPILRPLVASNKDEIVGLARRIGTHDLSARIPEHCALTPDRPETHARRRDVLRAETGLDLARLGAAVAERAVIDLRAFAPERAAISDLGVDEIPAGATVIDLRSGAAFKAWHYPGAMRMGYVEAMKAHRTFDRGKTYVFYCEVGLKSAHLAELLRAAGYRAYHVAGGVRGVRGLADDAALQAVLSPALLSG